MATETPAASLLDTVTYIDRAFRTAARAFERGLSVDDLVRERARPIPPIDGLIVREVEGGKSAALYFELSARLYEALTSGPAAFIFAVVAVLEMLGIHVRLRVYRDPSPNAPDGTVEDYDIEPDQRAPLIVVNYAPTIIVNARRDSIEIETDEDEARAIENRERPRVEAQMAERPARVVRRYQRPQ